MKQEAFHAKKHWAVVCFPVYASTVTIKTGFRNSDAQESNDSTTKKGERWTGVGGDAGTKRNARHLKLHTVQRIK